MTPHATGRRHRLQEGGGSTPYALLDTVQVWGLRETRRERLREGMIPQASTKTVLCGVSRCVRYGLDFPQAKLRVVATVMFYMQAGTIW